MWQQYFEWEDDFHCCERVHSSGTLEDTLLLIKFSQGLVSEISTQCSLNQALFEVLKSKNILQSIHGMHLWSHAMHVSMRDNFPTAGTGDQEKCLFTCNELSKNKEVYFEIYCGYVENHDGEIKSKLCTEASTGKCILFLLTLSPSTMTEI
jgi:hypothetical protein